MEKKLIQFNYTKGTNKPKYIVIHDTGNKRKGANADSHYTYFNGADRGASAHFFVDEKKALQVIELTDSAWHCGRRFTTNPRVKDCTNQNSIGIEICVNEDGDLNKAILNTQKLVLELLEVLKIPRERVITHRDCTGKDCPANLTFIVPEMKATKTIEILLNDEKRVVESIFHNGNNYIKLRDLECDKIKIDYDKLPVVRTV